MFRGVQTLSMDSKGRVSVPAKHRSALSHLIVAPNPLFLNEQSENCLWVYPYEEWKKVEEELSAKPNSRAFRTIKRFFLGGAVEYSLDSHGRVLLTPQLREFARLDKKNVLVGQGNKLELWSESVWEAQLHLGEDDDLAEYQNAVESMSF